MTNLVRSANQPSQPPPPALAPSSLYRNLHRLVQVAGLLLLCSCSESTDIFGLSPSSQVNRFSQLQVGACSSESDVRECSAYMDLENGTTYCSIGYQSCRGGTWGPCQAEHGSESVPGGRPLATGPGLVLAAASDCSGNACDPSCQTFDPPTGPLTPTGTSAMPTPASSIPDWSGIAPPWMTEPCESGMDCQINHRCEDVATDASCAHAKCQTGGFLNAACDPCVARICAVSPACCTNDGVPATDDWSAACVGLVKTECDAECGTVVPAAPCAHATCTLGAPLETTCDTCAATVCGEEGFEYCCEAGGAWDNGCVVAARRFCNTPPTPVLGLGTNRCDYSLMGKGALAIKGATVLGGDVGGGTGANAIQYSLRRPYLSHSIYSQGTMDIWQADILGSAISGGVLDPGRCVDRVLGDCIPFATGVPSATVAVRAVTCSGAAQNISANTTLDPGSYGAVTVAAGTTLTLQAGPYTMSSLALGNNARLRLPATGTVYLDLCGDLTFGTDVRFLGVTGPSDALRFIVYSNRNINVGARSIVYGMYTAPSAWSLGTATLDTGTAANQTTLYGVLHVSQGNLNGHSLLNATGLTGTACASVTLDPPTTCPPAVPGGSVATGDCVENAHDYVDPLVPVVDLALDFGCGNDVVVCNHGTLDAPAGAELEFFELSGMQMGTVSPDPSYSRGTCTVTVPVASGECVAQTCPVALTSADATVMVNPTDAAAIGEYSLLDNWTYFDAGLVCAGAPTTLVEVRRYEAVCPKDKVALWGLLSWESATPGSSHVDWAVRGGETDAEVTAATFLPLGTAQASPDTQVCVVGTGCAVDLTAALSLSTNEQPTLLEVEITLEPVGGSLPTVTDFDVTYSCVEDQ